MAEKNIALKITLDGVQYIINSVESLESAIKKLKTELDSIPKSSDAYSAMSGVIQGLENQLQTFTEDAVQAGDAVSTAAEQGTESMKQLENQTNKTGESIKNADKEAESSGTNFEKLFKNYVKIGSAVTASFAAAQSVLATFGADTSEIAEAAAKAQSLLTVAIAAKEAAEGISAATTVTATLATKLKTAADNTQIGVLKKLYTLLAANPWAIVAAAVGALVVAFVALTGKTKEVLNTQKELNKVTSDEATKLQILTKVLKDSNSSYQARKQAVEDLKKSYPGFNILVDEENRLTALGIAFTELKTKALIKEAQAKEIVQKISENNNKIIEIENRGVEESLTIWDKLYGKLVLVSSAYGKFGEAAVNLKAASKNNEEAISDLTKANEQWYQALLNVQGEQSTISDQLKPIEDLLKKYTEGLKNTGSATKDLNKATEEQIKLAKQLEQALNDTQITLEETLQIFEKLAETEGFDPIEPEVLQKLTKYKETLQGLIPEDLKDKFKAIGLDVTFENGVFQVKELTSELLTLQDTFGLGVEKIRKDLSKKLLEQTLGDFQTTIETTINELSLQFQQGLITREAFDAGRKLIEQYEALNVVIKKLPEGVQSVFTGDVLKQYLTITRDIAIATGDINYEIDQQTQQIKELDKSEIDLIKTEKQLDEFRQKTISQLTELYKTQFGLTTGLSKQQYEETISNLVKQGKLTEEQGKDIKEKYEEYAKDYDSLVKKIAESQFQALNQTVQNIVKEEDTIRGFLFQINKEREESLKIQEEGQARIFLNNLELVYDFTQKENQIIVDSTKTTEEQRIKILEDFKLKKIDLTKLSEEEIDQIIQFYLNKQNEMEQESLEKRQERYDKIIDGIQQFQSVLNGLSQTTSMYFDMQFDQLEKRYKRLQETIIGDSEEANKKRLEAEQAYQKEREALEKKAAKTALRISLAQALANTAEAITKLSAITGGVGAIVAGGALVAFNAAQVAIIANQLATIDSYKQGGRIKPRQMAGGGFVTGPSHEYGGVKFAQGGIELEGNESVINRVSTINYMGLLNQINQAGGGRPIGPGFDDSRIVEAIAKQRNTPIRAYVVESDITAKQETARRLEKLSQI